MWDNSQPDRVDVGSIRNMEGKEGRDPVQMTASCTEAAIKKETEFFISSSFTTNHHFLRMYHVPSSVLIPMLNFLNNAVTTFYRRQRQRHQGL